MNAKECGIPLFIKNLGSNKFEDDYRVAYLIRLQAAFVNHCVYSCSMYVFTLQIYNA